MNTKWIIGIAIVVIAAIAVFMLMGNKQATAPTQNLTSEEQQANTSGATTNTPVAVTYTDTGFLPATITVKAGQSVTFVNQSANPMWVASAMHPTHTAYDGNNLAEHCAASYTGEKPFDQCASAAKDGFYTFTFSKPGSWKYHNHSVTGAFGTVVVE